MKCYVFLLTLAVTLACLKYSDACSCLKMHLQSQYCNSDFVILARVKREKDLNSTRLYKVRVRKPYKLSEKAQVALKFGQLLTPKDEAMCGVRLDVGKVYAISGTILSLKAHINLCGMAVPWKDLTRRQRKGLKAIYRHGCGCRIEMCRYGRCYTRNRNSNACFRHNHCHDEEGICLRQNSKKCMWTRNMALESCLKNNLPFLDGPDRKSVR